MGWASSCSASWISSNSSWRWILERYSPWSLGPHQNFRITTGWWWLMNCTLKMWLIGKTRGLTYLSGTRTSLSPQIAADLSSSVSRPRKSCCLASVEPNEGTQDPYSTLEHGKHLTTVPCFKWRQLTLFKHTCIHMYKLCASVVKHGWTISSCNPILWIYLWSLTETDDISCDVAERPIRPAPLQLWHRGHVLRGTDG